MLIVKATDTEGNESTLELMVTVTDVDEDRPVFTSPETTNFIENSDGTVYTAVATDAGTITYSLGTSVDEEYFNIDSSTGVITFLSTPDFETPLDGDANNSYVLIVKATDNEGNESTLELMVTVTDVDEDGPVFTSAETASFSENTGGTVYTALATDAGTITYSLGTSVDEEYFTIDSNSGEITFLSAPDFETPLDGGANNSYVLIVKATDDEGNESTLELMVTVTDVDEDGPVFTSGTTADFNENGSGTVYTATVTDESAIVFGLGTSKDEAAFTINSSTGVLTFVSPPDFESPSSRTGSNNYLVDIKATDEGNNETILTLTVSVNDVDEDGPSVVITSVESDSTYQSYFDVTITFSEDVTDFIADDILASNASLTNFSSLSNSEYNVRVIPVDQGLVTISVAAGVALDISNNGNSLAEDFEIIYDTYDPSVVITSPGSEQSNFYSEYYTSLNPIPLRFEFSEPVYGFTASDLEANSGITVTSFSGSGDTYEAEVTTTNGSGSTVFVSLPGATVTDGVGNGNGRYSIYQLSFDSEGAEVISVSSDYADDIFGVGDQIEIVIHFNEEIKVSGSPTLQLETGDVDRIATYVNSWRTGIRLSYTIQEGDFSEDLDYLNVNALSLNGGSLTDVAGNNADLTLPEPGGSGSLSNNKDLIVDTNAPVFTSATTVSFVEKGEGYVYTAEAVDDHPVTFALARGGDSDYFGIDWITGELTFNIAPIFEQPKDSNGDNVFEVGVIASDGGNQTTLNLLVNVIAEEVLTASLSINDVTRAENADGGSTTDFLFTVTLSDNVGSAFTVDYGTGDNTATAAGSDYNSTSGTLNFAGTAGETHQIVVTVNNDDILEGDETFGVQLVNLQANGQSITVADDTGIGTITNDDQSTISISDLTKVEGNSGTTDFTFTVTMTGAVDQQVTVDYTTSDGSATIANGDYNLTSGTLTFSGADGESQTITVAVNGDNIEESNESFTISLSNIQDGGKGVSFAKSTAVATIANDDDNVAPSGFSVSFDDQSIGGNEVSSSTFTFSGAEVGTVYNYSITSAGGGTTVTGSGTIATAADQISIPDLSGLNDGLLTLSATLTDGSSNISNSQRSTTNLDKTGPIPTITSSSSGLIFTKTITATIRFNEAITGFTIDNLSSTNSVLSNFTGSGTTYTVLMTASADGEMTLTVPANITEDGLGNKNTVSNILLTKVEAFNAAPSGLALSDKTISEKLPVGTVVGEFSTTDPDDNDRHQYSLIAGEGGVNNSFFQIVDNQLITKEILNFQNIQTANIRVRTTDLRGSSFEKSFDIEVINQPEPRALVRFIYPSGYITNQYNFGRLFVGQEASVVLQVSNVGIDGDLNVSDIKLPDGYEASQTQFVVPNGATEKIQVKFSPTESKYFSGYGQVISNGGSPQFQISGYGVINQPPVAFDFPLRSIESNDRVVTLSGYDAEGSRIEFVITQSPQKGSFIDATTSSDGRSNRFLPQAGLTPGRYKDEFKFKVREVATGVESEEASGEFYFEIQDTKHEINNISIFERTDDYITLDLTFTDETVNSSYYFALRTFESYYSSFRGRTRYYWNLFYQNNFSQSEIETQNSILKHRFRLTGTAMQKLTSSGQVWVNLQLRDDRGLSQSFYIKVINDESGTKINVVNEGTEDGEFVVFGEDKSLPENETVDVDLSALEFGGFDLDGATIEISDNPLYGTVGVPSLVENSGEFARWRVSYTSTSETQQLDSIGFIVSHPARDEQFKAFARLEIIEVPDQPVLSSIDDQQIQEDESLSLELDYSDPDSELSVSVTSTDSDNVSLQVVDGILNVTPNQNYNGNVEILVTVTEADSNNPTSVLETFNLQILPVNDQPIMSAITDTQVNEDNSIELKLQATDADEELATFEFTATTDQPENVEISIDADVLTITPVADFNGDLTFYVKADDGEGTLSSVSEAETFVLKVNPVNDSPEVSRTIATQSIVEGLPAYNIDLSDYFSDPDMESSELTYTVGSVSNVSLIVNGSILTIQSVDGAEGLETVTITASDGVLSASQDVSFIASASSDEITVANALSDLNLEEDFDLQVIDISGLFAYSSDANAEFTYQLSGNNSVSAAISGTSLEIGALENFNGSDQLYIIGSTDGISAYTQININVSAINDAPVLVSSISDLNVFEDVAVSRVISNNIFTDVDGDALTYSASFDAAWLSFDAATRTFSGTPENNDVGTIEVTLTAEDPSGAKATDTFQIVVSNTNDDPTDIGISATAFDENISLGTAVATLSGTDPDVGDTDFSYSLISGTGDTDNSSFEIVDGQLKTLTSINFEAKASYSIRVKILDGFEGSFEKVFAISVNDVNEAATDIALATTFLSENQSPGSVINGFATTDPDSEDTHIYSLVAGEGDTDNDSFEIIGGGMASKVKFNFEEKSSYSVRVRAIDAGGLTFEKTFTINISDANDAPTGITSDNLILAENESIGKEIGTLSTTDEDASDSYTYQLVAGNGDTDNNLFGLESGKLVSKGSFNFETKFSYSVRVKSTDKGGLSVEEALTITISDANDAPTAVNSTSLEIAENEGIGAVIGQFTSIDEDSSDEHTYSLISGEGDADNDSFEFDGWNLKAKSSFNFETKSTYNIRVQSSDGKGGTLASQFTVNVTNVLEVELRTESSITVSTIGVGETETAELVLNNDGEDELEITNITFPEGYSGSFTSVNIAAGSSETLIITFEPAEVGTYAGDITITSNAGTNVVSITGEAEVVAGIEDPIILPSQVKLYPNPASQFVEIDLTDLNGIPTDLSIKAINGTAIWSRKEVRESKVAIDISNYADGAYLILVQTDRGTVTKRLLIRK